MPFFAIFKVVDLFTIVYLLQLISFAAPLIATIWDPSPHLSVQRDSLLVRASKRPMSLKHCEYSWLVSSQLPNVTFVKVRGVCVYASVKS
jgi:hypothetical protein